MMMEIENNGRAATAAIRMKVMEVSRLNSTVVVLMKQSKESNCSAK